MELISVLAQWNHGSSAQKSRRVCSGSSVSVLLLVCRIQSVEVFLKVHSFMYVYTNTHFWTGGQEESFVILGTFWSSEVAIETKYGCPKLDSGLYLAWKMTGMFGKPCFHLIGNENFAIRWLLRLNSTLSLFTCVLAFRKEGGGKSSYTVSEHWWAG